MLYVGQRVISQYGGRVMFVSSIGSWDDNYCLVILGNQSFYQIKNNLIPEPEPFDWDNVQKQLDDLFSEKGIGRLVISCLIPPFFVGQKIRFEYPPFPRQYGRIKSISLFGDMLLTFPPLSSDQDYWMLSENVTKHLSPYVARFRLFQGSNNDWKLETGTRTI